jgi:hypothetical protein
MEEKNFWLLMSVVIITLSGILLLVIGYIYFVVVPHPKISTSSPVNTATSTEFQLATAISENTPTPFRLIIITASPTRSGSPVKSETIPSPSDTPRTPTKIPTEITGQESPADFIRRYYSLINERDYETAFGMLSNSFKDRFHCCNPDGSYQIEPYIDWWNTIDRVTVLSVDTNRWSSDKAQVTIQIRYNKADGSTVTSTHSFDLVPDDSGESWLID